jgi:hypothetical protein
MLVQTYDTRDPDEGVTVRPDGNPVEVFADEDPSWVAWRDLAPWENVRHHLYLWKTVSTSDRCPGLLMLSDMERHRCKLAITDQNIPVLTLVDELQRNNWIPIEARHDHRPPLGDHPVFDSREAFVASVARFVRIHFVRPERRANGLFQVFVARH